MSDEDRALPKPPKTPFGRTRSEEGQKSPLLADELAMAAASGDLDEYIRKNLPDNEHARRLAMMMMGMTGMITDINPGEVGQAASFALSDVQSGGRIGNTKLPEDVQQAVMDGNLNKLKDLLMREHQKRSGTAVESPSAEDGSQPAAPAGIEKEVLDQLIAIASDNSVTLDWLIMRALKVYIKEYQRSGSL